MRRLSMAQHRPFVAPDTYGLTLRILSKRVRCLLKKDPELLLMTAVRSVTLAIRGSTPQLRRDVMTFMFNNEDYTPCPRPSRMKHLH